MKTSRLLVLSTLVASPFGCGGDPMSAEAPTSDPNDDRDLPADSFDDHEDDEQEDDERELVEPEPEARETGARCPDEQTLSWDTFGRDFMTRYCLDCHSQSRDGAARMGAPEGMDFDSAELVRAHAARIDLASGIGPDSENRTMPPEGETLPTDDQREALAEWIACGAPETECDLPGVDCTPDVDCDEGDENYVNPVTGHCYMLFSNAVDWEQARRSCEGLGGGAKLVTIQSGDENGVVADFVDAERVWLGASDRTRERDWRSITGESLSSTFTYWENSGPDGGEADDCIEMLGAAMARWTDTSCSAERGYVCERGEECLCDVGDLCNEECSCDTDCDRAGGCACDVSSSCDECWCEPVDDCPAQQERTEEQHSDEDEDPWACPECDDAFCDCDWTWGACDVFGNDWDGWYECECDPDCSWG